MALAVEEVVKEDEEAEAVELLKGEEIGVRLHLHQQGQRRIIKSMMKKGQMRRMMKKSLSKDPEIRIWHLKKNSFLYKSVVST